MGNQLPLVLITTCKFAFTFDQEDGHQYWTTSDYEKYIEYVNIWSNDSSYVETIGMALNYGY